VHAVSSVCPSLSLFLPLGLSRSPGGVGEALTKDEGHDGAAMQAATLAPGPHPRLARQVARHLAKHTRGKQSDGYV